MSARPADGAAVPPVRLGSALQLGVARAALLASRAALFVALGLAMPPTQFGMIAVLFTLGVAATLLLDLGVGLWLTRRAALAREETIAALGGLVALRLLLAAPALALYLVAARALLGPGVPALLAAAVGLFHLLLQVVQTLYAFLRGAERTGLEGAASLALHGAELVALAFWFGASGRDPVALLAALCALRALVAAALTAVVVRRERARLDVGAAVRLLRREAHALGGFALLAVAQFTITQADVLVLGVFANPAETGAYWGCYRIVQNLLLPVELLLLAAFPRLAAARAGERLDAAFRAVHGLGGAWALCVLALAAVQPAWVVAALLHDGFAGAAPMLAGLAVGLAVLNLPPYGVGLAMTEPPRLLARIYAVAAGANLALNLLLVPRLGAWGSVATTLVTHVLLKLSFAHVFRARGLDPWAAGALARAALPLAFWAAAVLVLRVPAGAATLLLAPAAAAALYPGLRQLTRSAA